MSEQTKNEAWGDLTIAIPAYGRPVELDQLLNSISQLDVLPGEVLICEDCSPKREAIREAAGRWSAKLAKSGCTLHYVENEVNLGYDGNVRKLFQEATRAWVMLMGDDDIVLSGAVAAVRQFLGRHPQVRMISRTFKKFRGTTDHLIGETRVSAEDRVYDKDNSDGGMIVRLTGFVGGLFVLRAWAVEQATGRYDGTLYYQMYLAALAFSSTGLGYIADPIVAARAGNPPLFGSAARERSVHRPGSYSCDARLAMWQGILLICSDVEKTTGVPLVPGVKRELSRMAFHVLELVAVRGRQETWRLIAGLHRLGVGNAAITWPVGLASALLGRQIRHLFAAARTLQRWSYQMQRT
jgi:glycosyltransferase involved in cell wall biosynthesis